MFYFGSSTQYYIYIYVYIYIYFSYLIYRTGAEEVTQRRPQVAGLARVAVREEGAHVVAVGDTKVLGEALPGGQKVPEAEVPLADGGGGIAGSGQQLRQRRLVGGEAEAAGRLEDRGIHPAAHRVPPWTQPIVM